jgi:hypothetical protein
VYPQPPLIKKKACEVFEAPEFAKVSSCTKVAFIRLS